MSRRGCTNKHKQKGATHRLFLFRFFFFFLEKQAVIYTSICCHLSGAVRPSGPVPLPRLAVVSEGQEREGRRLLVRPGHRTSVQQVGQRRFSVLPLAHEAAQPAESPAAGEMDQRGRGQCAQINGRSSKNAGFCAIFVVVNSVSVGFKSSTSLNCAFSYNKPPLIPSP